MNGEQSDLKKMKKENLFNNRLFWSNLLWLALPIALQGLLSNIMHAINAIMVGSLGDLSVAALGYARLPAFFYEIIFFGISSGAMVFLAQYHGSGEQKRFYRMVGVALTIGLVTSVFFCLWCALFPEWVIGLYTQDPAAITEAASYLRIAAFSYFGVGLFQFFGDVLRSSSKVHLPMLTVLISVSVQASCNYILIYGKFGFPAYGLKGAAIGAVIASFTSLAVLLIFSFSQGNILATSLKHAFSYKLSDVKDYAKRSLPVLFNEGAWSSAMLLANMIYGRMGIESYAAFTLYRVIENLTFIPFMGMGSAGSIMIGNCIGAGKFEEAKRNAKRFIFMTPLLGLIVGIPIAILRIPIVNLFDVSATTRHLTSVLVLIWGLGMGIRNLSYTSCIAIIRAGGDTVTGLKVDVLAHYLAILPALFLCWKVFNLPFLTCYIIALVIEDVIKISLFLRHVFSMKWIQAVATKPS